MRKIALLAFAFCAFRLFAQPANQAFIIVSSAPSGSCSSYSAARMVGTTGVIYTCQSGTWTVAGGSGSPYNPASVAITGGTIDNTMIGATTPSTGAFTTATTTGNLTVGATSDAAYWILAPNVSSTYAELQAWNTSGPTLEAEVIMGSAGQAYIDYGNGQNFTIRQNPASPVTELVINPGGNAAFTHNVQGSNTKRLTSDSSGITTTTPGVAEWSWADLSASTNYSFSCHILYSQATAAGGVGLAIQSATTAATRLDGWAKIYTSNAGVSAEGSTLNLTSTTATSMVSGTPSATGTVFQAEVSGTIQVGATAGTLNVLVYTGNASDAVTIKAGSFCAITP